ncbi:recombinase family protein [Streptomyces triticirhizae]|uniref:Recombinase family protein n=1 Tax=Streptomyces triticirhizae TaxID=2483353 RepID=A0A3M2M3U0_9ACTN|nr:recombinase family protein [Streptomyces triticirhizae]RMI44444.1 recombinase family protein [Streptomyces triticirhizae]
MSPEMQNAAAVERHACPTCKVEPGSACRTKSGKVAPKYHTPRFQLVPSLARSLDVRTPADRRPGTLWTPGAAVVVPAVPTDRKLAPVRLGYARCSTVSQELQGQLDELAKADCHKVFSEKISTRVKHRPELAAALDLAKRFKEAAPQQTVILTVTEMKRLGRDADELTTLARTLQENAISLEMLRGPLPGVYDPSGSGALLFAFFAAMAEAEREGIREATLEGLESARDRGRHGGRPKVITDDMLAITRARMAKGESVRDIAKGLTITEGKNAGEAPSAASLYRALAEADQAAS